MDFDPDHIRELAKRMETRPNGFRVSAQTAPLVIKALRTYAVLSQRVEGSFTVDVWTADHNHIVETLATAGNHAVGKAAYLATVEVRPGAPVTLRHGIRMILANYEE